MKVHETRVQITSKEFHRVNNLLAIRSLQNKTDEELLALNANINQNEGIYKVKFDDGSSINFNLCSNEHNYWDEVSWTSPNKETIIFIGCEFRIDDIEVEINSELYIIELEIIS